MFWSLASHKVHKEGSDQTGRMNCHVHAHVCMVLYCLSAGLIQKIRFWSDIVTKSFQITGIHVNIWIMHLMTQGRT